MPRVRYKLFKAVDEISSVRCAAGLGWIREETWQDSTGKIVRFNLAFINPFMTARDNGRVLGYDTAHGCLHRHFLGTMTMMEEEAYENVLPRFLEEVGKLKTKGIL